MNDQFQPLDDDEVLFVSVGRVLMTNPTFKVGEFIDALAQAISDREQDWDDANEGWFGNGLECEALRFGTKGWQRGKVRIRLEFCPDQDPTPKLLDSRRKERRPSELPDLRYEDVYRPEKTEPRYDNAYRDNSDFE
ncbi:KGK domain-containing protein [Leptothermofonsia sp. ETS-13]|uniref:KGK domain-containing protein n=1 Tax=Leptothermofonsia sp. ETS-13 TaxID=3035696 RepID=UPI003B9E4768